jgi:hypothetical protein
LLPGWSTIQCHVARSDRNLSTIVVVAHDVAESFRTRAACYLSSSIRRPDDIVVCAFCCSASRPSGPCRTRPVHAHVPGDVTCRPWAGSKLRHCSPGSESPGAHHMCTCCEVMAAEFMMGSRRTCRAHSGERACSRLQLRFVGNNRSCVRAVHRQARHYEFDVDRHVVHTDQEKIKSTGNINIFSRHGRKLFHPSASCHTERAIKSRIIRSAPPKE